MTFKNVLWFQIGIIGGSGLDDPDILEGRTERYVDTPYGKVSSCRCECLVFFSHLTRVVEIHNSSVCVCVHWLILLCAI